MSSDNGNELSLNVAEMPRDLAMMKVQNEQFTMLAAQGKRTDRDHKKVLKDVMNQISTYRTFAEQVIYSRPIGKDRNGVEKFARGLSIRAAEALRNSYGFNRVAADVQIVDDTKVKVVASFTDFCSGQIWEDSAIVSQTYRGRDGRTKKYSDDMFYRTQIPGAKSRVIREVILRSVPPGLRSELMEAAESKTREFLDDTTVDRILDNYGNKGIDETILESLLSKKKTLWNLGDKQTLSELWRAIDSGDTTVDEIILAAKGADEAAERRAIEGDPSKPVNGGQPASDLDIDPEPEATGERQANDEPAPVDNMGITAGAIVKFLGTLNADPLEWNFDKMITDFEGSSDAGVQIEDILGRRHPEWESYRVTEDTPNGPGPGVDLSKPAEERRSDDRSPQFHKLMKQISEYKQKKRLQDLKSDLMKGDEAGDFTDSEVGDLLNAVYARINELDAGN